MNTLVAVDPRQDKLWLRLIDQQQSSIFHSPAWIRAVTQTYSWEPQAYVLVDEDGQPLAGLPFCIIDDIRGKRAAAFPFSDFCDPIANSEEDWAQLLDAILALDVPFAMRCLHNDIPLIKYGDVSKQAAWHGADLDRSIEDIWASLHSSARRAVRKAEKSGVTVEIDRSPEGMRTYFDMHLQIRKYRYRLLAQPYSLFENIWSELVQQQNGFVLLAKLDGKPIGANVYLEWKNTLVYKFSASFYEYMNHRPTDALIWYAIKYAKENGLNYFDFGLSDLDQDGLLNFKRKYATEEKHISFLRYEPAQVVTTPAQQQAGAIFPVLTDLLTHPDVPDSVTEQGGDLLYRFFG